MFNNFINSFRAQALPQFVPPSESNPVVVSLKSETKTLAVKSPQAKHKQVRFFSAAGNARNQSSWITQDIAINALLQTQLYRMRARSRSLTRNTSPGKRFTTLCKNNIIGPDGIRVQSRSGDYRTVDGQRKWILDTMANDAIELHFKKWSLPEHCDVTGKQSFEEICRMLAALLAQDGEVLVKEVIGTKDTPYRYQLQAIAIDRLDINYNATASNGNEVRMGVEVNSAGKAIAYYLLMRNPNDSVNRGAKKHERVLADELIHLFIKSDPEQLRGYPWTHAVMNGERMLGMFQDAALEASVVGATTMGMFFQTKPGEAGYTVPGEDSDAAADLADGVDENGEAVMDAVGASFRVLGEGISDFKQFDPKYPHAAYQPFVKEVKLDLASGLDVAAHNLSGDMSGVNYSSARVAELSERDVWRALQKWIIGHFMRRVVGQRWLQLGLLSGAITMDNGYALPATKIDKFRDGLLYVPRGWDWVDPKNEIGAAVNAIENGLTTRTKVVASKGGDFEENIIELAREQEIIAQHKVRIGQQPMAQQAAPATSDNGQGDTQDE
jgi:lambda family phage portal protein